MQKRKQPTPCSQVAMYMRNMNIQNPTSRLTLGNIEIPLSLVRPEVINVSTKTKNAKTKTVNPMFTGCNVYEEYEHPKPNLEVDTWHY